MTMPRLFTGSLLVLGLLLGLAGCSGVTYDPGARQIETGPPPPSAPVAMTITRGGRPRSITMAAHAIATAVTAIVIVGQLFRRKSLAAMQPCFRFCEHLFERQSRSPTSGISKPGCYEATPAPRVSSGCPPHFGGSKPLLRQRSAIAVDVRAAMKARAAAGSVLLAGIAAA